MQLFARVPAIPGPVLEIIAIPNGANVADLYTPEIVATLVSCGAGVAQWWSYDGVVFAPPPPPVVNPPPTPAQLAQAIYQDSSATAYFLRGLVVLLAQRFGTTPAAVVQAIINAAN